jgi:hypothetical protein
MAHLKGGTYVGGDLIVMTDVYANVVRSFAASGTSPFVINSSTLVNNLNVNYLGGYPAAYFASAASLSNYLPLSGGYVSGKTWLSYGNTSINGYSWVDAALTTTSIEIVNSNGSSSNSPTLAFHWYGAGGPQFRLANDGSRVLYLESAGANSARTGTGDTTYFDSLRLLSSNSHGIYINGNNVWHAGNDGSGSGLDADTVDGYQASSLVKTLGTINNNIDSDYGEGFVTFDPVPTGTPPLSSPNIRTINVGNVFSRRTQLAFDYDTDRAFFRRRIDGGWQSWYEFIHTGNISSQTVAYAGLTVVSVTQASHGFSVGNIIRVSGANTFVKAQSNSAANAEVVGYVTSVADANNFKYTTGGMVTSGVPAATAGTVYYLDPTTAGAITSTEPTTGGQISKPVLIVIESAAKAAFVNFRGMTITATDTFVANTTTINGKALTSNITLAVDSTDFTFSDVTTNDSTSSKHGLLPKLSGNALDVLKGNGTWGAASSFWTPASGTPTRASNTTFTVTGDYTSVFAKGLVIKWTESSTVRVAMVSIPSTYSAPNTTVTIIGDTMASIDSASLKYCLTGTEAFVQRFVIAGNISAAGTDVANAFVAMEPYRVIGSDLYVGTAGTTGTMTIDINKNGTTMFTTKPSLATTVSYSPTPFTSDSATSLALGDKVTLDIDTVHTTAAIDLYVQLYVFPTRYLNL